MAAGLAVVEVSPVSGRKATTAAGKVGLKAVAIPTLLVQGDNKAGLGHAIAQNIAAAEINVTFLVAQVIGTQFSAIMGFEGRGGGQGSGHASQEIRKVARAGLVARVGGRTGTKSCQVDTFVKTALASRQAAKCLLEAWAGYPGVGRSSSAAAPGASGAISTASAGCRRELAGGAGKQRLRQAGYCFPGYPVAGRPPIVIHLSGRRPASDLRAPQERSRLRTARGSRLGHRSRPRGDIPCRVENAKICGEGSKP